MDKVYEDFYADKQFTQVFWVQKRKPILQWWKQKSNGWNMYEVFPRFEPTFCT